MYFSKNVATFRIYLLKAVFSAEKFAVKDRGITGWSKKSLCTWRLQYNHQVHKDFLITLYIKTNTCCLYKTLYSITLKQAAIFKPIFKLKGEHFFNVFVHESRLFCLGFPNPTPHPPRHLVSYGVFHQHVTSLFCLAQFACHFYKHLWHVLDKWFRPFALWAVNTNLKTILRIRRCSKF